MCSELLPLLAENLQIDEFDHSIRLEQRFQAVHRGDENGRGITDAELRDLHEKLAAEGERWTKPRPFQAGMCYRTLCAGCNGLLGRDYDPELAEISHTYGAFALPTPATTSSTL